MVEVFGFRSRRLKYNMITIYITLICVPIYYSKLVFLSMSYISLNYIGTYKLILYKNNNNNYYYYSYLVFIK